MWRTIAISVIHLILANAASLAGHISIGDHAIIGGLSGIHQYVRIGPYSMVGGCCAPRAGFTPVYASCGRISCAHVRPEFHRSAAARVFRRTDYRAQTCLRSPLPIGTSGRRSREAGAEDHSKDNPDVLQVVLAFMEGTKRGICRSVGKDQEHDEE